MKVKIEIDCTPQEARTFLGQPDVEALNDWMVEQMKARMGESLERMRPEELMKDWMAFGGQAADQFRKFMGAAAASAPPKSKP